MPFSLSYIFCHIYRVLIFSCRSYILLAGHFESKLKKFRFQPLVQQQKVGRRHFGRRLALRLNTRLPLPMSQILRQMKFQGF